MAQSLLAAFHPTLNQLFGKTEGLTFGSRSPSLWLVGLQMVGRRSLPASENWIQSLGLSRSTRTLRILSVLPPHKKTLLLLPLSTVHPATPPHRILRRPLKVLIGAQLWPSSTSTLLR
jgi:hypothetical protein